MSRLIPHCGPTLGYRVTWDGVTVAYLSDHQQPSDGSHRIAAGALELCDGADLVIHDAQYTPSEFARKSTWGHCTVEYAVRVAHESGAKRLALFHHDPLRDDDALDELARETKELAACLDLEVMVAAEGSTVSLTFVASRRFASAGSYSLRSAMPRVALRSAGRLRPGSRRRRSR